MKTKITALTFILSGAIMFNSCTKDDSSIPDKGTVAVKFASTLGSNLKTASTIDGITTTWLNTDQIGIYMLANGEALNANTILSGADNIPYQAVPQSDASIADFNALGNPIYYPNDWRQSVNFIAYYPYLEQIENYSYPVDVSTQTNTAALDLLYSNDPTAYDKQNPKINLPFIHALSQLRFNIHPGTGMQLTDFVGISVIGRGMPTTASFSFVDKSFTNKNGSTVNIPAFMQSDGQLAQMILIPQGTNEYAGRTILFSLTNGSQYSWNIPDDFEFVAGSAYSVDITISNTSITVENIGINDWVINIAVRNIGINDWVTN